MQSKNFKIIGATLVLILCAILYVNNNSSSFDEKRLIHQNYLDNSPFKKTKTLSKKERRKQKKRNKKRKKEIEDIDF